MLLQLTDGVTTDVLSGVAPVVGCIYFPQTPKRDADGKWKNVVETATVHLSGTPAAIRAEINAIENYFVAARERVTNPFGNRVYVEYRPVTGENTGRSEIFDGMVEWPSDKALRHLGVSPATVSVTVRWERAPTWELPLTQLPLTNSAGSNNTSGLTVHNHDDTGAGQDNYVEINAANLQTVAPAPIEIRLKNITGAARGYYNFYLALNDFGPSLAHMIEGEAAHSGWGTVVALGSASNGYILRVNLTAGVTAGVLWSLPAGLLQQTRGRYLHVLMRASYGTSAPIFARAFIRDATGLTPLARTLDDVQLPDPSYLQNLGMLPFPPGNDNATYAAQKLWIEFRSTVTQTIDIDFLQLTPAKLRIFQQVGHQVLNNEEVVDDGINETVYFTESGANHPLYTERSERFMLTPRKTQRIYILHDGFGHTANWTLAVRLFYRPQRFTV